MSEPLQVGLSAARRVEVDLDRIINFMGDNCRVYSTPKMLYDIEMVCRDLLLAHIERGQDSVGTRVALDHIGATPLGMWVDITVTVAEIKDRTVTFDFVARDAVEEIAHGKHSRFIVGIEKTAQRLKTKLTKAV